MAIIHTEKWKSEGLGDTIEKITMATGIKKVVETIAHSVDADCGCEERKKKLNNPNLLVNRLFYNENKTIFDNN